jgi:hypothetical protein
VAGNDHEGGRRGGCGAEESSSRNRE